MPEKRKKNLNTTPLQINKQHRKTSRDFHFRSDGIKIIVHKKKCNLQQKCTIKKITSALEKEIQIAILKKAVIIEKESITKKKRKRPEIK